MSSFRITTYSLLITHLLTTFLVHSCNAQHTDEDDGINHRIALPAAPAPPQGRRRLPGAPAKQKLDIT